MRYAAKIYPLAAISVAMMACGLSVIFNFVVDPYGSYHFFEFSSAQSVKPAIYRRVKLAKAYDLRRLAPEAIVLGTSRSHIGLRMTHPGWGVPLALRYNGAFDGATTKEMYAYLRHAHAVRPLRHVVLGLDTWQLGRNLAWTRPDFDPAILFDPDHLAHNLTVYAADLSLLVSTDTTRASIVELMADRAQPSWLAADGQRLGEVFFREVEADYPSSPGGYFRGIDRQEIGYALDTGVDPSARRKKVVATGEDNLTSFDYIAKIVHFCRRMRIDLRIFLTPAHAHQLEIASQLGTWGDIERGKRELVDLLERDGADHPEVRSFPLYDFAGYSSVTTEPVPAPNTRKEMTYYWDSSHFKQVVGDLILDRLFETTSEGNPVPADFGVRLTHATVETALKQIRAAQLAYRAAQPQEMAFIKSLVEEARAGSAKGIVDKQISASSSEAAVAN
jgi:hypothetical protein